MLSHLPNSVKRASVLNVKPVDEASAAIYREDATHRNNQATMSHCKTKGTLIRSNMTINPPTIVKLFLMRLKSLLPALRTECRCHRGFSTPSSVCWSLLINVERLRTWLRRYWRMVHCRCVHVCTALQCVLEPCRVSFDNEVPLCSKSWELLKFSSLKRSCSPKRSSAVWICGGPFSLPCLMKPQNMVHNHTCVCVFPQKNIHRFFLGCVFTEEKRTAYDDK